ncbi:MAG TPA: hypothetical protein VLT62_17450 [Candidatus Methylomirabilis sp.]|nr:hypothetical protein [Candidatus Methylomirabilis sp.]
MPMSYDELAEKAWDCLENVNARANPQPLSAFVGRIEAKTILHHFHSSALPKIADVRFEASNPVPSPSLKDLANKFGHVGASAVTDLKNAVTTDLGAAAWSVLEKFGGGGAFLGITYDRVVWVNSADLLDTVLHELVHTLQWKHFGRKVFLSRYLQAFAGNIEAFCIKNHRVPKPREEFGVYKSNPAETSAYDHQQQCIDAVNTALGGGFSLLNPVTMAKMKVAGGAVRTAEEVLEALSKEPSANITSATAIHGM